MSPKLSLVLLLLVCKCSRAQSEDDCESIRNCKQCIHAPACGWYLQYRTINGSGCFRNAYIDKTNTDDGYAYPPKSTFHVLNNRKGSVISPQQVALNLRLNDPFTFPVTFTPRSKEWGKTRTVVELVHNTNNDGNVKITFFSNCNDQHNEVVETNKCEAIEFGQSVEFLVKVQQVRCKKRQPQPIKKIEIRSSDGEDVIRLVLFVYAYCYCPCEYEGLEEVNADCHRRGKFTCGVCYCQKGYAGDNCQINTSNNIN